MPSTGTGAIPKGPWVLVTGMHRSGTSALAGALARLGLQQPNPQDLVSGKYDNPVHYESEALVDFDDRLLNVLGGSWSAPPALDDGWENSPAVRALAGDAVSAARRAFSARGPIAWKDPRLCLLLPFWRDLVAPARCVYVWRPPLAVARSLRSRQGFTLSHGLALWGIYAEQALRSLETTPVMVISYERALSEPAQVVEELSRWLVDAGVLKDDPPQQALRAAGSSISAAQSHEDAKGQPPGPYGQIASVLESLAGAHEGLGRVRLPQTPSWAQDAIAQRREYEDLYRRYMRYVRWRRRIPVLPDVLRRRARRELRGREDSDG